MLPQQAMTEAQNIKPLDRVIDFDRTAFPLKATLKLVYPYGYEFVLDEIEAFSNEDLNQQIRMYWNVEPNYTQN